MEQTIKPLVLCGKPFSAELIEQLNKIRTENPVISKKEQARQVCEHLGWYSPNGTAAISSASVAINKLQRRGLLTGPRSPASAQKPPRRLRRSEDPLPPVKGLPTKAGEVKGLYFHLVVDCHDPLHPLWNDLIIDQHPSGATPLAGPQVRYLIGSEHGWLGAMAFGPAAFVLGARDTWIGWSPPARVANLAQVVGLARFLIRKEVRCTNLASMLLGQAVKLLPGHWENRYGSKPLLLETFVERERYKGMSLAAANWRRIGTSTGRGRLGNVVPDKTIKDIWVYPLCEQARGKLQQTAAPPVIPSSITGCVSQQDWASREMATLELGDQRLHRRAEAMLEARWRQPQASFYGSFESWAPAKAAYGLIEHTKAPISMETLLKPHKEATLSRMAGEAVVLLPQDTSALNFTGLKKTTGLGPLGDEPGAKGRGLWLHSMLAYRPDGVPLGVLDARCWARQKAASRQDRRGRNAKSIDEKESARWLDALHLAAEAARRIPATRLVNITDREGDLYELHDCIGEAPANLHNLIRAQHDRNLEGHNKLWAFMAGQACGATDTIEVPRRRGQKARKATVQIRWSPITIEAPKVGAKKNWPPLSLWAVWLCEPDPPAGVEPLQWMLLTDMPIANAQEAWEKVRWYRCRWGIEEWHRVIKSGCRAEAREFKSAEHLKRVLAFDLIVAWRILACVKLGHTLPQLSATVIYTAEELKVLWAAQKKRPTSP